jgi:hypothetical protein
MPTQYTTFRRSSPADFRCSRWDTSSTDCQSELKIRVNTNRRFPVSRSARKLVAIGRVFQNVTWSFDLSPLGGAPLVARPRNAEGCHMRSVVGRAVDRSADPAYLCPFIMQELTYTTTSSRRACAAPTGFDVARR